MPENKRLTRLNKYREEKGLSWAEMRMHIDSLGEDESEHNQEVVGIREFFENPHYTGSLGEYIWPKVLDEMAKMNNGHFIEVVATGGIGAAKTSLAIASQLYQLYYLSTYDNPHAPFELKPTDEIVIIFQSMKMSQAKEVAFDRFKAMVDECPYFENYFPYDKDIKSQLRFPHHITVMPVAGNEAATIGKNVIGGMLDEVNFMASVEKSKQNADGGTYEQAVALYNSIARRRESRFMVRGQLPGLLHLVSSKRFRGQFTDVKTEEAKKNDRIYVYDKCVWDVVSDSKFEQMYSGDTFDVFVGDEHRKPFIIDEAHKAPEGEKDGALIQSIPIEYENEFNVDLLNALRDIAGVSTTALHPFIMDPEKVVECFGLHPSVFSREECDFDTMGLEVYPAEFVNPDEPRFVHIDLAISRDSCGFAVGHVSGFAKVARGPAPKEGSTDERQFEMMPNIHVDALLEIRPPRGGEILFSKVRDIIYLLTKKGMNIKWVTFDSFQSTDARQILAQQGYSTATQSLDSDTQGYEMLKTAFYDGRLDAPTHTKCLKELLRLERDEKKDKIDHRPKESKDVADGLAGIVYGLTRRLEIWHRWKVPVRDIPKALARKEADVSAAREEPEEDPTSGRRSDGFQKRHEQNVRKQRR